MGRANIFNYSLVAFLALCFLAVPLVIVIPVRFSSASFLVYPPPGLSTRWFEKFLTSESWTTPFFTSLKIATAAAGIATVLGTLSALGLDGSRFRGKGFLILFLMAPLLIPLVIIGIATYSVYISVGVGGSLLGLVLAHALLGLPFTFLSVSSALSQFDSQLRSASQTLGASPLRTFLEVTLPLIATGIAAGSVLAFMISFNDVVLATFLAGQSTQTLPLRMVAALEYEFDPTIAAVSTVLLLAGLMIFILVGMLNRETRHERQSQS